MCKALVLFFSAWSTVAMKSTAKNIHLFKGSSYVAKHIKSLHDHLKLILRLSIILGID